MRLDRVLFKLIYRFVVWVRGEKVFQELEFLRKSQYFDKAKIQEQQLKNLNNLLLHASKNVDFYKERVPNSISSIGKISNIPFLTKEDLRANQERMRSPLCAKQRAKTSGGSTGAPITVYKDSCGMGRELAAAWRGYEWAGIEVGDKQVRFWGVPKSWKDRFKAKLIDFVCHRIRISAFNYSKDDFIGIRKNIRKFGPDYFYGYKSMIEEFSECIGSESYFNLKAVISTAEMILDSEKKTIGEKLSARIFNEYGCGEVGTIAHECEAGNLHINAENLIVEVIDSDGIHCSPGELGEIVITDLTNFSMPLIRYRLSDFGSLEEYSCSCGRALPVLRGVKGREYDTLVNSQGKRFHGEFFLYILEDARKANIPIDAVQFVQGTDYSISIKIKCHESKFSGISDFIRNRLLGNFDKTLDYKFERVDEIPRESSGKMRPVKRLGSY